MSDEARWWAAKQGLEVQSASAVVLNAIANDASRQGVARVGSPAQLAAASLCSVSTLRKYLRALEDAGLAAGVPRSRAEGLTLVLGPGQADREPLLPVTFEAADVLLLWRVEQAKLAPAQTGAQLPLDSAVANGDRAHPGSLENDSVRKDGVYRRTEVTASQSKAGEKESENGFEGEFEGEQGKISVLGAQNPPNSGLSGSVSNQKAGVCSEKKGPSLGGFGGAERLVGSDPHLEAAIAWLDQALSGHIGVKRRWNDKQRAAVARLLAKFPAGQAGEPIKAALEFAFVDRYWSTKVTTASEFEQAFDRLAAGAKAANKAHLERHGTTSEAPKWTRTDYENGVMRRYD